jgi:hypothetical protein
MNNNKSFKWGYGVVIALVLGLSGCYMDNQSSQEENYSTDSSTTMHNNQASGSEPKATQKSYASKEPTQKATPGPKRTAAPQLPVIQ